MTAVTTAASASLIEPRRVLDPENPWPGLDAFDESAERFFNGRDTESEELARLVGESPLTVLFGKSGLGKTSLIKAGLFPLLRNRGIFPVYVRLAVRERDGALIDQVAAALVAEADKYGVQVSPPGFTGTLWELLHQVDFACWSATNRPLVPLFVLDQFEEVFTLGAANRAAIDRLRLDLADLIENRIPGPVVRRIETAPDAVPSLDVRRQRYKVLLSFREDFLPDIETWRSELPSLMRNRIRLREMTAAQGFAAVYETGSAAKLVDQATAREIVRFVGKIQSDDRNAAAATRSQHVGADGDEDEFKGHQIEPALLSLVCAELNKRRRLASPPRAAIDAELLRGTAASIIADFYLHQVARIPPASRRFIEEELLTEGGYRSSFPVDEALQQGVLTEELLRTLIDGRLLRIEYQLGVPRVELTHDRLTDVIGLERDRRRAGERSAGRRRTLQLYAGAAIAGAMVILFGAFNWVARSASERERAIAGEERDEARRQREIAERASGEARAERDEAQRQRAAADEARRLADVERQRAESQRALAEARLQQIEEEQERARRADARATAEAARAENAAADAKRQNAVLSELYTPVRPAVLRVGAGPVSQATAFFVTRSGLAITAGHVVNDARPERIPVRNFDDRTFTASVVRVDRARDLALLQVADAGNAPCLPLTPRQPSVGTTVIALSIAMGREWVALTGTIQAVNQSIDIALSGAGSQKTPADLLMTDMSGSGGFSGTPVIDPYARGVIGIGAYGSAGEKARHYLIPASRILAVFSAELAETPCS